MFTPDEVIQIEKNLADGFPPFDEPIPYEEMDLDTRDEYDYYQRQYNVHYEGLPCGGLSNDWRD